MTDDPTREEVAKWLSDINGQDHKASYWAEKDLNRSLPFLARAFAEGPLGAEAMNLAAAQLCQQKALKDAAHLGEFANGYSTACSELEDNIRSLPSPSPALAQAAAEADHQSRFAAMWKGWAE